MTIQGTLIGAAFLLSLPVSAQPSKGALAQAGKAYRAGKKAYQKSDYLAAIAHFEEAFDLSEDPILLFNMAQAQRKQFDLDGDTSRAVKARDLYTTLLREQPATPLKAQVEAFIEQLDKLIVESRETEPPGADLMLEGSIGVAEYYLARQAYEDALAALDKALTQAGNAQKTLAKIYWLRGTAFARAGKAAQAEDAFRRLLVVKKTFALTGDVPAEVAGAFEAAQLWLRRQEPVRLEVELPSSVTAAVAYTVDAKVSSDPLQMIDQVGLGVRPSGSQQFRRVAGRELSADMLAAPQVELYVVALDSHGGVVLQAGSSERPLVLRVAEINRPPAGAVTQAEITQSSTPPPGVAEKPWHRRWWVWAAVGAVVVAATTGAVVATRGSDEAGGGATEDSGAPSVPLPL